MHKIGLIAGNGDFPLEFAKAAKRKGLTVVTVAHEGETRPELSQWSDVLVWIKVGQLGKLIKVFHDEGVTDVLMAGGIRKTRLFQGVMPDMRGAAFLARMLDRSAERWAGTPGGTSLVQNVVRVGVLGKSGSLSGLLFPPTTVPEGHFFVLSDNRVDERDSRIYGAIPHHAIVGVLSFVYYLESISEKRSGCISRAAWTRLRITSLGSTKQSPINFS